MLNAEESNRQGADRKKIGTKRGLDDDLTKPNAKKQKTNVINKENAAAERKLSMDTLVPKEEEFQKTSSPKLERLSATKLGQPSTTKLELPSIPKLFPTLTTKTKMKRE